MSSQITYQFRPGKHFARPFRLIRVGKLVHFDFLISSGTYHDRLPDGQEGDWNKLGYIFSGIHPHVGNSVTLVWKWEDRGGGRKLYLGWYGWQKSKSPTLTGHWSKGVEIEPDKWYSVTIDTSYYVTINIDGVQWETTLECKAMWMIGPYFGGQATSPGYGRIEMRHY